MLPCMVTIYIYVAMHCDYIVAILGTGTVQNVLSTSDSPSMCINIVCDPSKLKIL